MQYEIIKEQRRQSTSSFHPSSALFPSGNNSRIFDDLFNDLLQYEEEEVQGEYKKYFSLPTANWQTDPFIWWNK
ncbi:6687_t:CDS:2 [Entrophospora sp. SA101]|nr:6687_t:CDS:2 [Entrophospora sp. SA101]